MNDWYRRWFGEEYLALYPHRDEEDARAAMDLAQRECGLGGKLVLDLACGAGRHASELLRRGAAVVGLDLSETLLRIAVQEVAGMRSVRADMRHVPLAESTFDLVVNLFTSFGYFSTDREHQQVLDEMARVLKPGGCLFLDFLNPPHVRAGLVASERKPVGGEEVLIERRITADGRFVIKEIHHRGGSEHFMERVRLLERGELEEMARAAGLEPDSCFGDYDGAAHGPDSPRTIIVARRG